MYVIVRSDLPSHIQAVQASHAVLAATQTFNPSTKFTHPHLVILSSPNEESLAERFNRLKDQGVACVGWYEGDLGDQLTAVATAPLAGEERRFLRGDPLLKCA